MQRNLDTLNTRGWQPDVDRHDSAYAKNRDSGSRFYPGRRHRGDGGIKGNYGRGDFRGGRGDAGSRESRIDEQDLLGKRLQVHSDSLDQTGILSRVVKKSGTGEQEIISKSPMVHQEGNFKDIKHSASFSDKKPNNYFEKTDHLAARKDHQKGSPLNHNPFDSSNSKPKGTISFSRDILKKMKALSKNPVMVLNEICTRQTFPLNVDFSPVKHASHPE